MERIKRAWRQFQLLFVWEPEEGVRLDFSWSPFGWLLAVMRVSHREFYVSHPEHGVHMILLHMAPVLIVFLMLRLSPKNRSVFKHNPDMKIVFWLMLLGMLAAIMLISSHIWIAYFKMG